MEPLALDDAVRCGVMLGGTTREQVLGLANRAEALGFDSVWVGDHVSFHVPILESLTTLAFLAGATRRVTLGTAVYLLPLRHPTIAAKITGTLAELAGGRLVLGVGVGGEFPPEFEASGVPVRERGARTDEAMALLRRLWTEDGVAHEGRHFRFGPVSLDPKPATPPPLWVGGRRAPAFRRAGRLGDGCISHMTAPETFRANLEAMRGHAREAGRAPQPFGTAALLFSVLDDDTERAAERAAARLGAIYRTDFRDAARRYCLLGRRDDALAQLRRFVDAGARHFILSPLAEPVEFAERVAAEILPELRSWSPSTRS